MNEWLMILAMALGGVLFAAGGTDIPKVGGQKWLRRFLLSAALGALCFCSEVIWWKSLILAAGLCIAFHLPYGSNHSYWVKTITAVCFVLPTISLGFSYWQLATPVAFIGMFWLSNNGYWGKYFPWKIVEFLTGVYISVTVVQLVGQSLSRIS